MGPGDLDEALCGISLLTDKNVLRGMDAMDNAGVYKINATTALVQTVDFFTPIVDDPYMFGQIAVANSLSDVYTMGARPLTALNIVCFPTGKLKISILKDILRGGSDKMREAGVILMGGHSIDDPELKYGLAVTGVVHPARLITNSGAKVGDKLILTKPLGTGIISTAVKAGKASKAAESGMSASMAILNKTAAEIMRDAGVHSCTDITGFGLIGHIIMMANNSGVSLSLISDSLPVFPETVEYVKMGLCPGGLYNNKKFYENLVTFAGNVTEEMQQIVFDPQTSGGLLISVSRRKVRKLLEKLQAAGVAEAAIVGEVTGDTKGTVTVQ